MSTFEENNEELIKLDKYDFINIITSGCTLIMFSEDYFDSFIRMMNNIYNNEDYCYHNFYVETEFTNMKFMKKHLDVVKIEKYLEMKYLNKKLSKDLDNKKQITKRSKI